MLIDAHCHLANLSSKYLLPSLLDEAQIYGIEGYLSNALTSEEVRIYQDLNDKRVKFSAGVHPHFEECTLRVEDINRLAEQKAIWAVGEIGLDRNGPPLPQQQALFEEQLKIASDFGLPVVLHIVGFQTEAWQIIRKYPLRYLIHGYAGSLPAFELFAKQENIWFTISERILRLDKTELLQAMIDSGKYLFETDITAQYAQAKELNPLLRLVILVSRVERFSGIPHTELLQVQADNYQQLLGSGI
ncbi:MAG TPA: TatD family deoxyribonuclease [Candidatus Cloacimonas sp.]|jgi:Tat protein secretion system quality control protein TatD with DNase activity|nr:TatD family deoxyribonuclease [Candidatus Cloacimonas sp.]